MSWRLNRSGLSVYRIRQKAAVIERSVCDTLHNKRFDAQSETCWLYPSDTNHLSYQVSQLQRRAVLLLGVATRVLMDSRAAHLVRALLVADMPYRGIDLWCSNRLGVATLQQAFQQARHALGFFQFGMVALSAVWLSYCAWCLVVLGLVFPSLKPLPAQYNQAEVYPSNAPTGVLSRIYEHSAGLKLGHLYNRLYRASRSSEPPIAMRIFKQPLGLIANTPILHVGMLSGMGQWMGKESISSVLRVKDYMYSLTYIPLFQRVHGTSLSWPNVPLKPNTPDFKANSLHQLWLTPNRQNATAWQHKCKVRTGSEWKRMTRLVSLINPLKPSIQTPKKVPNPAWVRTSPSESQKLSRLILFSPEFRTKLDTQAIRLQHSITKALGTQRKAASIKLKQEPIEWMLFRVSTALASKWQKGPIGLATKPAQACNFLGMHTSSLPISSRVQPPCSVDELALWRRTARQSTRQSTSILTHNSLPEHTVWRALEFYDLWLNPFQSHPWKHHAGMNHTGMLNALYYLPLPARSASTRMAPPWLFATRLATHFPFSLSKWSASNPFQPSKMANSASSIRLSTLNMLLSAYPLGLLGQEAINSATRHNVMGSLLAHETCFRETELDVKPAIVKHSALGNLYNESF